jgi:PAS domain S-box-containing protein
LASNFHPDVALLDIQMPGMDGYQVCRALKASPETCHIPVVFLTAHGADPESRIRALDCGGDAFLAKPVEPAELMAQVRAMIRLKKAEEALRRENASLQQAVADGTAALGESRWLLAAVVGGTPDAVWVKDRNGRYLLANASALLALGRPASEVLGHTAAEFLEPGEAERQAEADRRVLDGGETFTQEEQVPSGGMVRTVLTTRGRVHDAEGHVIGLFGVAHDISERARVRLVLQKETDRVKALLALYRMQGHGASEVVRAAVEGLTVLTGSQIGLIGLPSASGARMEAQSWSARPLATGPAESFQQVLEAGDPWSEAIRSRQAAVLEGYEAAKRIAFPPDFPAVRRFQAVPVVRDGQVVMVGAVANRDEPYGELDVAQAELYLEGSWEAIQKSKAEEFRASQEELLRQASKMEAVGRLAGGVAHDFNNLLVVILSYARFAIEAVGKEHPVAKDMEEIVRAAERAAALTRQLLAYSRKQVLDFSVLDLNQVVTGSESMLRRLLREDLELVLQRFDGLWPVRADRGQLEQVIVNLVVNARDAIPQRGRITIRTGNLAAGSEPGAGAWDGPGVLLEVVDTGIGMDQATQARAFDPFFTTKERGRGTGLGLATVQGIVKQCGGDLRVQSALGVGSTFRIVLPRSEAEADAVSASPDSEATEEAAVAPDGEAEAILVVEDEDAVRALAERILTGAGYHVLTAANGAEALEMFARHKAAVKLLLTDVVMPRMSGRELASRLELLRPGLPVLYMSGYLDDVLGEHGILTADIPFIGKPFTATELVRHVRQALAEVAATPA